MKASTVRETMSTLSTQPSSGDKENFEPAYSPFKLWSDEKQCILAVDDIPENIEIIRNLLGKEYQIKAATKGSKAIEIARRHPQPDLILLDVMMPEMNGFEVCRILKTDADTLQIPIIFITGNSDAINETEGFEMGATDYITKPFHPAIIRSRVQTHLQLQREQKKVDQLLENLFPRRIIQDLKFRGFSSPESFNPVTIMFAELLTPETEYFSPEQMTNDITDMFTVLDGLVARHGAEHIKSSSYTYVATCGMPVPNINHARVMLQTAVDFLNFFKFSSHSRNKGWKVRIGLNTGSVIGSVIGRKRYHYDIFGEAVKIAIQIKDFAPAMSLLVSDTTMQLVKNSFSFNRFTPSSKESNLAIDLYELSRDRDQLFAD
ncbi:MAG: adenylate/guanylate cyclase [uncultured bacterium]|nr:MAG: adenylate/guanylate cyclase [uncultured bacterium]